MARERFVNQELEELRNAALQGAQEQACQDSLLTAELIQLSKGLHASWFLHPRGYEARQTLCESLTSVAPNKPGSWQHFAGKLGIPWGKILCISNQDSAGTDKAELSLMIYAQQRNATLDQIILVLQQIDRLDTIKKVQPLIKSLADEIKSKVEQQTAYNRDGQYDSGFSSISAPTNNDTGTPDTMIIHPKDYDKNIQYLKDRLPISLRISETNKVELTPCEVEIMSNSQQQIALRSNIVNDRLQQASRKTTLTNSTVRPYKKTVFLTFASDGKQDAYRIAQALRNPSTDRPPCGVLILHENSEIIQSNPELLIKVLFDQADYIMPIITEEYLERINFESRPRFNSSTETCLDICYVKYILDLMRKYYHRNECLNDKFRCIIPNTTDKFSILRNTLFFSEPTLRAWAYESNLEFLAQRMNEFTPLSRF
ncbi:uncharacterized protein LOC142325655 [Lycorma delicatula]|uniref:uncharacterized protein LOC142325655 n=1 Tax=Lycorma delicatula TaxID=130591 RepID=UPI003F512B3B